MASSPVPSIKSTLIQNDSKLILETSVSDNTKLSVDCCWMYIGVPFRPSTSTYSLFSAKQLPKIDSKIMDEFKHISSLVDVQKHKEWLQNKLISPTSCYVDVDMNNNQFYCDQQDCVVWNFTPDSGVYIIEGNKRLIVANSIPEFFARCYIENSIWHTVSTLSHPDAFASISSFLDFKIKNPASLWKKLQTILKPSYIEYITEYANHAINLSI